MTVQLRPGSLLGPAGTIAARGDADPPLPPGDGDDGGQDQQQEPRPKGAAPAPGADWRQQVLAFRPDQARDERGRWTGTGRGAAVPALAGWPPGGPGGLTDGALWKTREGRAAPTLAEKTSAAKIWYSGNALGTNRWLRDGEEPYWTGDLPQFAADVARFRKLIGRAPPLTRDAVMWRGFKDAGAVFGPPGSAKGRTFTDRGFVSLAAGVMPARSYGRDPSSDATPALMRVTVPAGTRALRADPDIWDRAGNGGHDLNGVQEYTLADGHRFEVTGDVLAADPAGRQWRVMDVTVRPPGPAQARPAAAAAPAAPGELPGLGRFGWAPGDIDLDSDDGPARAAFREDEARDDRGRWTSGGTGTGKVVLAAVDRGLARFRGHGERMADEPLSPNVVGHFAGLLGQMRGKLRKKADQQRWDDDLGVTFTRYALNPDVSGSRVHVAIARPPAGVRNVHDVIAGAVSFYEHTEEDPFGTGEDVRFVYVDYLGTTGAAAGAGTALAVAVARYAAARNLGVMGEPSDRDAAAFWRKLGWHEDPYDLSSGFLGWTPEETAEVAARAR